MSKNGDPKLIFLGPFQDPKKVVPNRQFSSRFSMVGRPAGRFTFGTALLFTNARFACNYSVFKPLLSSVSSQRERKINIEILFKLNSKK